MADMSEELGRLLAKGFLSVAVREMVKNPDVTDDVLGREAWAFLNQYMKRPPADIISPHDAMKLTARWAAKIRTTVAMAVAAALDEDPGAPELRLCEFVHLVLLREIGETHTDLIEEGFSVHLALHYAPQCRRSGLPPEQWLQGFRTAVENGAWAFAR